MFLPACRYVPTCSEYAMEAVERYGALRGGVMALLRLLRCHPFASGGYDPVPQGLKPDISDGLGGAAGSLAVLRQEQKAPLLAKDARNGAPGGFHCGPPKIPNRVA